ncbi:MAG: chromosomal replication initiator protein DnaA [Acidobacteria bacterium]|nr:chromosomal replication initiator protein DnaA [Acidobacteriota bacterium]MBK8810486.1 chromosomal replication initiator protein DnaA [Acidobacteriota bacterium]
MEISAENNNVWNSILHVVERRLNKHIFDSWFRQIQFQECDEKEQVLHLKASPVTIDWINSTYSELIKHTLRELDLPNYRIDWQIEPVSKEMIVPDEDEDDSFFAEPVAPAVDIRPGRVSTNFVDIEPIENSLNQKYTFEKFVVGACNEFAHAAALGAAESPGKTYNPLFIYGGVGLGKTHLMHAIGHSIKERNRHLRVAYITSEKFMNELINAIRYDKTQTFREKYRSIDVLLMDDVQFMAGKERTQEEFFHTFNALHNDQKQIVISSDCPPREIPTLEERLHSRFEWGLIADIEPPDLETKVAILKRKADLDGFTLPDDIAMFIAGKVRSNIRELEGSLVRLVAISSLRGMPISKMLAQDAMRNVVDNESEGITMPRIAKTVAAHYKLTVEEMKSKNNSRQIAVPRQVAMYLCKRLTKHSFPEIGREFGGKHHTTVMHSVEKIDAVIKDDRNFHRVVSELIDSLCS